MKCNILKLPNDNILIGLVPIIIVADIGSIMTMIKQVIYPPIF